MWQLQPQIMLMLEQLVINLWQIYNTYLIAKSKDGVWGPPNNVLESSGGGDSDVGSYLLFSGGTPRM